MFKVFADFSWLCHFTVVALILLALSSIVVFFKIFDSDFLKD